LDPLTARRTIRATLASPKLIDRAARKAYEEDCGTQAENWDLLSDDFKDVFRSTVEQALRCTEEALRAWTPPEWAPKRAALPWEEDAARVKAA